MDQFPALKVQLNELAKIDDVDFAKELTLRKKKEIEHSDNYHDYISNYDSKEAKSHELHRERNYYKGVVLSDNYVNSWIDRHTAGKVFLDLACGNGLMAVRAAKAGARLAIGIDLSGSSIQNARDNAKKENVTQNTFFLRADAENTQFPSSSIDAVVCCGVLHHMDLSYVFPELRRILVPGGKVLAHEALNYNPIIRWYRNRTPHMRTEWEKEHILGLKEVNFAKKFFQVENIQYWHLSSILTPYAESFLQVFNMVDRALTKIPLVQLMAWIFTFELVNKKEKK